MGDSMTPRWLLHPGCAIGVVRMALWVVLLAVDSPLLTDNDTMIRGTLEGSHTFPCALSVA